DLKKIFERDLDQLAQEISAYSNESDLWVVKGEIKNSAGNLCLHLCGNLQHFVGKVLGGTDYVRNREAEFADKHIPRTTLLKEIATTRKVVSDVLHNMSPAQLDQTYPVQVFGEPMTTGFFLIHLATHLTYHRGQINYHRRLL
ncbi:MAG TPA: DinB family protein, partial [Cyclobacteriaceae bacterium]|nr:DinB family protein [Cyclobacteriaceae bacterium]